MVWNSFHGRFSDNPRAMWERLADRPGIEHVWLADRTQLDTFPAEMTTADIDSGDARTALESADLVVANTHTEVDWEKSPSTMYLQTWHGTPLKRIHRDVLWAPEGRLDRLDRDIAKWDLLLSPNAISTPRLQQAFRYDGEVLESGYPRNDILSSQRALHVRSRVRADLGIPDTATAVLYAPTWRDQEVFAEGAPSVPWPLDLPALSRALGSQSSDYLLMARAHNMVTGRSAALNAPELVDVSMVPDVAELYCAADVLVTDYSSSMFDFVITGRPVLLFTPDLEQFETKWRGFYFDLVPVAPGPLVGTVAELAGALRDLADVRTRYATPYAAFKRLFAGLEDGHATDRVLARLDL